MSPRKFLHRGWVWFPVWLSSFRLRARPECLDGRGATSGSVVGAGADRAVLRSALRPDFSGLWAGRERTRRLPPNESPPARLGSRGRAWNSSAWRVDDGPCARDLRADGHRSAYSTMSGGASGWALASARAVIRGSPPCPRVSLTSRCMIVSVPSRSGRMERT